MKYKILEYTPSGGTDAWTTLYDSGSFYSGSSSYTYPTHVWDGYNFDVTTDPASTDSLTYYLASATVRVSAAASSHDYKIYHTKIFSATQEGSYPGIDITSDGWTGGDRAAASPIALPKNLGLWAQWIMTSSEPSTTDYTDSVAAIFVVRNSTPPTPRVPTYKLMYHNGRLLYDDISGTGRLIYDDLTDPTLLQRAIDHYRPTS